MNRRRIVNGGGSVMVSKGVNKGGVVWQIFEAGNREVVRSPVFGWHFFGYIALLGG